MEMTFITIICTLIVAYIIFYSGWVAAKPKVYGGGVKKKQLREMLLKHCPILSQTYWPTFWAFQCHLTTVLRFILQKDLKTNYIRLVRRRYMWKSTLRLGLATPIRVPSRGIWQEVQ